MKEDSDGGVGRVSFHGDVAVWLRSVCALWVSRAVGVGGGVWENHGDTSLGINHLGGKSAGRASGDKHGKGVMAVKGGGDSDDGVLSSLPHCDVVASHLRHGV